jgi:hypothetical protein
MRWSIRESHRKADWRPDLFEKRAVHGIPGLDRHPSRNLRVAYGYALGIALRGRAAYTGKMPRLVIVMMFFAWSGALAEPAASQWAPDLSGLPEVERNMI